MNKEPQIVISTQVEAQQNVCDYSDNSAEATRDTHISDESAISIALDLDCKEPACIGQLRKSYKFRKTWDHERDDFQDHTLSRYDYTIALMAAAKGLPDQVICDLIVVNRRQCGDVQKNLQLDYIQNTITRVRASLYENESKKDDLFSQYAISQET